MLSLAAAGVFLILGAGTSLAVTTTHTGTLSDDDPSMTVVTIVPPECIAPGGVDVHYDVIEFLHPLPGTHSFQLTSNPSGFIAAYLYEGSFDPSNPLENCVAADNSAEPLEITFDFVRGTPYFLVVIDDTFAQAGGDWEVVVESPDPIADTVGLVDPATGQWNLLNQSGALTTFFYGNPGDVPFMGDWDCDGVATPGLFRLSDAFAYLRNSNNQGIADIRFFFGNPSDIPLAGDFNGDGCDTLSLYRPSEQRFYIINELGANEGGLGPAEFSFQFGNPGDKPFVGDFDGDGIDEVGLHRESTGFVYYRNTLDTGIASNDFFFGDPGDRFVAGDWGVVDRVATPGLFRPSGTTFYFRHTNTEGNADSSFIFGQPSWLPVSGAFGLD
ncbi:MAG TPA: hypothetical protein VLA91_15275 [Acidimicrobiia bacterium]|nr:hypothetical protein [Acidimicrobiia bacterium]